MQLEVAPLCHAAPYSLRPLAALLNPYARGCSVLCNHPADNQTRDALRRAKEAWVRGGAWRVAPAKWRVGRPAEQRCFAGRPTLDLTGAQR